jgi:hypothetical protein
VPDPIYGRPITKGTLARDADSDPGVVFSGDAKDDNLGKGLEPFVRYVYWADVRLPPERRLPAGVAPIDPAGGITALDAANALDKPRPMSLPSAPRVLMRVPSEPPAAPLLAAIRVTRTAPDAAGLVELTVEIDNAPVAHARAIGPYRLAIWTQWGDQAIEPAATADGAPLTGTWPDFSAGAVSITVAAPLPPVAPAGPIRLRLALVDPTGRLGDVTTVPVP